MKTPATQPIEQHPLGFFLPENTKLLMLGSFPPPRARWSMNFYYPNIQNDMWRILGLVFYNDKEYFLETKKAFSEEKAKALSSKLPEVPKSTSNHHENFLLACMGKEKARSPFEIIGPLKQKISLGDIAQRMNTK